VTRKEVLDWLATREPIPPAVLRVHLERFVDDGPEPMPQHLARLGRVALERVMGRQEDGGRELALDLLAADAFVTYAFEAQALFDVAGLARLSVHIAEGAW